jgi:hypothetical protein
MVAISQPVSCNVHQLFLIITSQFANITYGSYRMMPRKYTRRKTVPKACEPCRERKVCSLMDVW